MAMGAALAAGSLASWARSGAWAGCKGLSSAEDKDRLKPYILDSRPPTCSTRST